MAEIIKISPTARGSPSYPNLVNRAVNTLLNGGVILFPTETVYGIGADIRSLQAIHRLFEIKGRPPAQPLLLHCSTLEQAVPFVKEIPNTAWELAKRFLPGPLALIFYRSPLVPDIATGGNVTVGIRVVKNSLFFEIAERLRAPIVGTSANIHRQPPTNEFRLIPREIVSAVDLAIEAGIIGSGNPSTVLDLTTYPPKINREGDIKKAELEATLGLKLTL
ncbi:MAG: L-threonylcarbamoyladenylate synthase [bacterium]